jgi:hypothetical protein
MNMTMRLAQRILSQNPAIPISTLGSPQAEGMKQDLKDQRKEIARCPKFIFDAVHDYCASQGKKEGWDPQRDFPNFAPPFTDFFAEWNTDYGQSGVFVRARDLADFVQGELSRASLLAQELFPQCTDGPSSEAMLADMARSLLACKWIMRLFFWATDFRPPLCGRVVCPYVCCNIFVDAQGACVNWIEGSAHGPAPEVFALAQWAWVVFGMGLSFLHCRNVARPEIDCNREDRWHQKTRVPRMKFYTLDINPMREVLRVEGHSEENGIRRALHICRGHFAHYSEEKPLFGKYPGTFWVPDHVRGTSEAGVVIKDYRVRGGS